MKKNLHPFNLSVIFLEKHCIQNLAHCCVYGVENAAIFFAVFANPSKHTHTHTLETKWLLLVSLVLGCGREVTQAEVR